MDRLKGKVALITGAAHGIGEGIARMFAAEGASVILADKDADAVSGAASAIKGEGGIAHSVVADISITDDVKRMVEAAAERFSGLDILVNNAALTSFGRRLDADDMEARYDLLMTTNLKSAWMALHYALPHLKVSGGSVINIASVHGLATTSENSAYAASKGAMIAGTRAMAVELAPARVRINCISPGMIWNNNSDDWLRRQLGQELYAEYEARFGNWQAAKRKAVQPLPIAGRPEDIAYCAVYLASEEARFCTGANFVIDGGATALLANPSALPLGGIEHWEQEQEVRAWIGDARRRCPGEAE